MAGWPGQNEHAEYRADAVGNESTLLRRQSTTSRDLVVVIQDPGGHFVQELHAIV
jgi:hypothetical protein